MFWLDRRWVHGSASSLVVQPDISLMLTSGWMHRIQGQSSKAFWIKWSGSLIMGTYKIRANTAEIQGEYLIVSHYSWRPVGVVIGIVVGVFIISSAKSSLSLGAMALIMSCCTGLGGIIAPGRIRRLIPNVDLAQIKYYDTPPPHVTVVLDDERTKRKQAVAVKK